MLRVGFFPQGFFLRDHYFWDVLCVTITIAIYPGKITRSWMGNYIHTFYAKYY